MIKSIDQFILENEVPDKDYEIILDNEKFFIATPFNTKGSNELTDRCNQILHLDKEKHAFRGDISAGLYYKIIFFVILKTGHINHIDRSISTNHTEHNIRYFKFFLTSIPRDDDNKKS